MSERPTAARAAAGLGARADEWRAA